MKENPMLHVRYTKRELAAILRCTVRAARQNKITTSDMQNIVMGVFDALAGRYERIWANITLFGHALQMAPNGRPYAGDLPPR